ncbi:MAG: Wzt carbohydrate-binding domain-containing protein [Betaproteobacteria bacterium]|nr:Wzt carbohydrate-binding domain-containing protein [Betaproteobacteria bacterium]
MVFQSVAFLSVSGQFSKHFSLGENITIRLTFRANISLDGRAISIAVMTDDGLPVCNIVNTDSHFNLRGNPGVHTIDVTIEDVRLYPGRFLVGVWAGSRDGRDSHDHIESGLSFEILDGGTLTSRPLPRTTGLLFLTPRWNTVPTSAIDSNELQSVQV